MHEMPISTPVGAFTARFSRKGLLSLDFPRNPERTSQEAARPSPNRPKGQAATPEAGELREWTRLTQKALQAVLAGHAPDCLPPLDWGDATDFQRRVWGALRRIPPGQVRTYAQVAAAIGSPRAARAVGGACGANPIPVLVPCHRVTAASGGLGGFSGGLGWKRRLLDIEGVPVGRGAI